MKRIIPGKNVFVKSLRSPTFIGNLLVRNCSSNKVGGGTLSNKNWNRSRGITAKHETTNGIQYSDVPQSRITKAPMERHNPAEKIKLTASDAPNTSVMRLPSRYPNTIPQTKPNGNPFVKRNIKLYGAGTKAKKNQDAPAIAAINKMPNALECAFNSEITLMPMNLANA